MRHRGIGIKMDNRRNLCELFMGQEGRYLRIPKNKEAQHIGIAGDTGTGKSTIIRQFLHQIEARGENAIIFDPSQQYTTEFYNPQRGDWILNPKDKRTAKYNIKAEADDLAEAMAVASSMFPEDPSDQKFFRQHTRAIMAHLLSKYKPETHELAYWMAHEEEIDYRVKGTHHEVTLTKNAAPQRGGILGSMNMIGAALQMLGGPNPGARMWSAREWSEKRKGWIFITSTPDTLDALRPLQSMWIDLLILKLNSDPMMPVHKKTWVMIDELASLGKLPQLLHAMTNQRKSGNPMVIGYQAYPILEKIYGPQEAKAIISQPFFQVILRTGEETMATHQANQIGKARIERVRETRQIHHFPRRNTRSYSTERIEEHVVTASTIQNLGNRRGIAKALGNVVRFDITPDPMIQRAAGLEERKIPDFTWEPAVKAPKPEDEQKAVMQALAEAAGVAMGPIVQEDPAPKEVSNTVAAIGF